MLKGGSFGRNGSGWKTLLVVLFAMACARILAANPVAEDVAPSWDTTDSLSDARFGHSATLLRDGRVLVAGGGFLGGVLRSVEVYDPASEKWSNVEALDDARLQHTATLLSDGTVLLAGGRGQGGILNTCEVFNPATGEWSATGSLNTI